MRACVRTCVRTCVRACVRAACACGWAGVQAGGPALAEHCGGAEEAPPETPATASDGVPDGAARAVELGSAEWTGRANGRRGRVGGGAIFCQTIFCQTSRLSQAGRPAQRVPVGPGASQSRSVPAAELSQCRAQPPPLSRRPADARLLPADGRAPVGRSGGGRRKGGRKGGRTSGLHASRALIHWRRAGLPASPSCPPPRTLPHLQRAFLPFGHLLFLAWDEVEGRA